MALTKVSPALSCPGSPHLPVSGPSQVVQDGEEINDLLSISLSYFPRATVFEKEPGLGHSKIQNLNPAGHALASTNPHFSPVLCTPTVTNMSVS